jgi:hypothetical protein
MGRSNEINLTQGNPPEPRCPDSSTGHFFRVSRESYQLS